MPDIALALLAEPYGTIAAVFEPAAPLSLLWSPPSGVDDVTPPTVATTSPGGIMSAKARRVINVTDPAGVKLAIVWALLASGEWELVWDGSGFAPRYGKSVRRVIANGFSFEIERTGDWPSGPLKLKARAWDNEGNEV